MALHGERAARWSEVAAAHALLGYERRDAGICPVVLHPTHGEKGCLLRCTGGHHNEHGSS